MTDEDTTYRCELEDLKNSDCYWNVNFELSDLCRFGSVDQSEYAFKDLVTAIKVEFKYDGEPVKTYIMNIKGDVPAGVSAK